jgi:hypothetical protein
VVDALFFVQLLVTAEDEVAELLIIAVPSKPPLSPNMFPHPVAASVINAAKQTSAARAAETMLLWRKL